MGKPYIAELAHLPDTYSWAVGAPITELATAISASSTMPLLVTGSGGSLTAAHFAAQLHQKRMGMISKASTPLELISSPATVKDQAVLIISAGGTNSDIIAAFRATVGLELKRLIVICSRVNSPLSKLASAYRYVDLIELDLPSGKDGFLATNSLLAFAVILSRGWAAATAVNHQLPADLADLLYQQGPIEHFYDDLADRCAPLWGRETISVLYGPSTRAAAVDLESKFTEAALGSVQIADYRNFAHGRHHWLAKRGQSTGVLAFITDEDRAIAKRTLDLIPTDIPVTRVDIPFGSEKAAIASLVIALHIVRFAGGARGIDPGRPGVPSFGSKIYHLPAFRSPRRMAKKPSRDAAVAIERKTGTTVEGFVDSTELQLWTKAYSDFAARLRAASFGGIVLDYDGTLCDGRDRFTGIGSDVASEVTRLLRSGIVVGIATGRGRSVRSDFRRCIPNKFWDRFLIGYYNGAEIGFLGNDDCPDGSEITNEELSAVADAIRSHGRLNQLADCEYRRKQISIVPKPLTAFPALLKLVEQVVRQTDVAGVSTVTSSHSLDVLASGVSKQTLVDGVRNLIRSSQSSPVLCVGDRGQWPGNDFVLLAEPLSLSVDEVSQNLETCWNLAPAGYRGVQAALYYLKAIKYEDGSFHIDL